MLHRNEKLATCDPVWSRLREEAEAICLREPALAGLVQTTLLAHARLEEALSARIAEKLGTADLSAMASRESFDEGHEAEAAIGDAVRADIVAVFERDPACNRYIAPFLFFKGFHALEAYRVAHWLWTSGREDLAWFL